MKLPVRANIEKTTASIVDADGEHVALCWAQHAEEIVRRINGSDSDKARREAAELRKVLVEINEIAVAALKANT